MNWKEISNQLTELHKETGSAVVMFDPHSEGDVVNLSTEDFCLEVEGKELHKKKVRKFLWENRKKRALQRKNALLWSSYLEDEDKSYIGVGAITSPEAAKRLEVCRGEINLG